MIWRRSTFALSMTKRPTSWMACLLVLLACACAHAADAPAARQANHLDQNAGFDDLCNYATPWLERRGPDPALVDYRVGRTHRTLAVHAVDITSRTGGIAYESSSQLLTPVQRGAYPVFDGSYSVRLRGEPLLAFELDQDVADSVQVEWKAGNAAIRIYFVLDAFRDPFAPFCAPEGSGVEVRGVLLAAHLIRAGGQGRMPAPGDERPLGRVKGKEGRMYVTMLGLNRAGPPAPPHKLWVGRVTALKSEIPEERLAMYSKRVAALMGPCHLSALASGGPSAGSLVVVTHFENAGVRAHIPVEVTGFPAFGKCGARVLTQLRPEADDVGRAAKFVLYFEPRR
jgi:hypothetical protein